MTKKYSSYEAHQEKWEELAKNIAELRPQIKEIEDGQIAPSSKKGQLTIIGTGIETIGISMADQKLLEEADKVLYCVADPATIVWIKRLRPDALDLYVLYGENKVRYTTYMQMTEAQLYWVRQGLNVVVAFYGHPGIFVLSTHRAIQIAKREGYTAVMKGGVSALDTLCADLGVDPSHPGLQTHEATDCIIRQRNIDTSLHVILWQVGLIGELGYRRQGYLNNNFSYFINWLEEIYGEDYPITHYIGSRYPSIDPTIEVYSLKELHNPEVQVKITGISTFYIPPRDVIPTDYKTALDLGIIEKGQKLVTPKTPLREIGLYGHREMKAFDSFTNFKIPSSYKWQANTAASNFLIELRFDTELQQLYRKDPIAALNDQRFKNLSDKERSLLVSRDSGAIQIAAKGAYIRSFETEASLVEFYTNKTLSSRFLKSILKLNRVESRDYFKDLCIKNNFSIDWAYLQSSIDVLNNNNIYPWTGVYIEPEQKLVLTVIGNKSNRKKSIVYVNDQRVYNFKFEGGVIKFKAKDTMSINGYIKFDVDMNNKRRILGKVWKKDETVPTKNNFIAYEVDPDRKECASRSTALLNSSDQKQISGNYVIRTNGIFSKELNSFNIEEKSLIINGKNIDSYEFKDGKLSWSGGDKACYRGEISFLIDPIIDSIEVYGESFQKEDENRLNCYGSMVYEENLPYSGPKIEEWAKDYLAQIVLKSCNKGGLLLWHKWEKHNFTSMVVNKYISNLN